MSQAAQLKTAVHPSREDLLHRAELLVPRLRERAASCEKARTIPAETVTDFEEAGFYRIAQPRAYGGYELSPTVIYEVAMILASACPSSGWCMSLISTHNWTLAMLDPRAAADVWEADSSQRVSSSYAPFGKAERVQGGFRVSGRWPWSSGCDHCQWVSLGAKVPGQDGGPDELQFFLIPRSNYQIDDTWHVAGLQGTGSKDIVVNSAFVPEHRTHKAIDSYLQQDPGLRTFTAATFRYPLGVVFTFALASPLLGMAKGALATYRSQMLSKSGAFDGAKAIEDPYNRQRVAEAEAAIRGCEMRLQAVFRGLGEYVERGEKVPLELRVSGKWDAQVNAKASIEAVTRLFKAAGGSAIRLSNPMQRYFRDAHAASNHAFLNSDKGSFNFGGILFGADNADYLV
jgi:3-hydroxy-9,10-secoandrosta-1,3,5(10)-triene-9,17-dione monooxygenase